jgi:energy-coupling factor transport system substrate-specific component
MESQNRTNCRIKDTFSKENVRDSSVCEQTRREDPAKGKKSAMARVLSVLELPALLAVPVVMIATALAGWDVTAGLTLLVAVLAVGLMFASFEASKPPLRQLMPTAVLAATAAAGRVLFAPIPDVKPVSAIAIVAGAALGRRSGFVVGAVAALISNFFFGQGSWTPWQMYGWGLVGYMGGVLSDCGALKNRWVLYGWGFLSGLMYGAILNGYYVLGYIRPLTWPSVVAAYAAGAPLDCVHGVATAAFLAAIWLPWGQAIRRVVAKYDLASH